MNASPSDPSSQEPATGEPERADHERSGPERAVATVLSLPPETPLQFGRDAPLDHVMASVRAMRRLKPDPVPTGLLEELIEAATWGPSASNSQQYGFVVVTDREKMGEIAELWRTVCSAYQGLHGTLIPEFDDPAHQRMMDALQYQADHFHETPALIAACHQRLPVTKTFIDPRKVATAVRKMGWGNLAQFAKAGPYSLNVSESSSIYPAVQNILLAARARGLAANLTVWHLFREAEFRAVLGVPDDVGVFALIPVGYPVGNFGPVRRRPVSDVLHWNSWEG